MDFANVSRVRRITDELELNSMLDQGWKLLAVTDVAGVVTYVVGWTGPPVIVGPPIIQ